MKKLLVVTFCGLILAGCGDSIPSECATTIKEYDDFIAQIDKQAQVPDQLKTQLKDSRKQLEENIKKLDKDQAVQTCKIANQQFAQLKQMLPKE